MSRVTPRVPVLQRSAASTLLTDTDGRIDHLVLQFGNREYEVALPPKSREAVLGVYQTLFRNMAPTTEFTVVVADEAGRAAVRRAAQQSGMDRPERVRILNANASDGLSIWIRDSMLPKQTAAGQSVLIAPDRSYFDAPADRRVPQLLGQALEGVQTRREPLLSVDGGNVVSHRGTALVGIDSIAETGEKLRAFADRSPAHKRAVVRMFEQATGRPVEKGAVRARLHDALSEREMWRQAPELLLAKTLGKPVQVVGKNDPKSPHAETQPAFHIDMAVTPLDEQTFLVGDVGLGLRELERLPKDERRALGKRLGEKMGVPRGESLLDELIEENRPESMARNFDRVADELRASGNRVIRVPYLSGRRYSRRLPYVTYNNCLQETYRGADGHWVRKAYLPQYGIPALDRLGRSAYAQHGFDVIPLDMAAITMLEGAIRCSAYPIRRSVGR